MKRAVKMETTDPAFVMSATKFCGPSQVCVGRYADVVLALPAGTEDCETEPTT